VLTAEMVKSVALRYGADAVGIGSVDRFEGAPKEMDPRYISPRIKSIIGMIFRIPRGYIRGCEEGTHFFQYPSMGYGGINEVYAPMVLYNTAKFIEDHSYEGIVYRNTGGRSVISDMTGKRGREESPELYRGSNQRSIMARPAAEGLPAPDVFIHFRLAAYICGLGEIGYSKMFLTPQFGPMNRQAFILTDAELEPDPIYKGPPLCNRCMACVMQCPGSCLSREEQIHVNVAGHEVSWGKLNEWKCFAYYIGANKASNPFLPRDAFKDIPDGEALIKGERKTILPSEYTAINRVINSHYPNEIGGYNPPKCGGCLRACLNSMEKRGVLNRKFHHQFCDKKSWKMEI
jgi:ferredoxin